MRTVGVESQRTFQDKMDSGFFDAYMKGHGLDIGYAGYVEGVEPILPSATGVDLSYPGYNGITLPFGTESQDYVHSSHCLEHINDYKTAIKEWHRVIKSKGHLVIIVPHQFLYEKKKNLPSIWNMDHKRFYTPASLLAEVEQSLVPNTYRVRMLEDGDKGFTYDIGPNKHSGGQYEITLVLQKILEPDWEIK